MNSYRDMFSLEDKTALVIGPNCQGIKHARALGGLVGPAIFLASSASDFFTGHTLFVDGGVTSW